MYTAWHATMNNELVLLKQLEELKEQHRQLDAEIHNFDGANELELARKKKRKLQLKDMIATLEVEIYPDQPA